MKPIIHYACYRLGCAKANTQTSPAEQDALARHSAEATMSAEIGVFHGINTRRIAESMGGGDLYAVDPFYRGKLGMSFCKSIAEREMRGARGPSIHWIRETGESAAKILASTGNATFDFVFIDGDHSYEGVRGDWEAWKPLIKKDGLVLFHDSQSTASRDLEGTGVVRLIDNVVTADPGFRRVDVVDSISVFQRIG